MSLWGLAEGLAVLIVCQDVASSQLELSITTGTFLFPPEVSPHISSAPICRCRGTVMSFLFAHCATGAQRFQVSDQQLAWRGLRYPPPHPLLSHIGHTQSPPVGVFLHSLSGKPCTRVGFQHSSSWSGSLWWLKGGELREVSSI